MCPEGDLGIEAQVGILDPRLAVCLIHLGTGAEPFNLSASKSPHP